MKITSTSYYTRLAKYTQYYQIGDLSMHCFLKHKNDFKMGIFKLGIVRKMAPLDLDREEEKFIFTFRTKLLGLNRIVVTR